MLVLLIVVPHYCFSRIVVCAYLWLLFELNCSGVEEHNLPDSPFASPTKTKDAAASSSAEPAHAGSIISNNSSPHLAASSLFPPTPTALELPPYKSCFFQVPRWKKHQDLSFLFTLPCSSLLLDVTLWISDVCVLLQVLSWPWSHRAVNIKQKTGVSFPLKQSKCQSATIIHSLTPLWCKHRASPDGYVVHMQGSHEHPMKWMEEKSSNK